MSSEIKVDTISEKTSANGVTIDGLTIKDGNILGDVALAGTTPTFTIGDAGAEDAALIFDGNQVDFVMGVDDSADEFRLGIGTTLGSTRVLEINSSGDTVFQKAVHFAGSQPTVTVGDGGAEDVKIVFDGNAVDYYIALDDSADNLIIGSGSTVGSNSLITIDSDGDFTLDSTGDIILDVGGGDIKLTNAGSNVGEINLNSNGGDIQLANKTSDKDLTFHVSDSGSIITALQIDGSDAGTAIFNHDVKLGDNSKAIFGAGSDLEILHNSSSGNSFISDVGTGSLIISSNQVTFQNAAKSETLAQLTEDGTVSLRYDNTEKLLTSSTGINLPQDGDGIKFGANSEVTLFHVHNAGLELSAAGNLDTLKLVSTDDDANVGPVLNYYRNSGNVADNDYIGRNLFTFNNDAPEVETALAQNIIITDASNGSEDVKYIQEQMTAGSIVERFTISSSEAVFNEGSVDVDFRVESNGQANMLLVDGGNDHVNIGTASDLGGTLNVSGSGVFQVNDNTDTLKLVSTDDDASSGPVLHMVRDSASPADGDAIGRIHFSADNDAGEEEIFARIKVSIVDASDGTEDAQLRISRMMSGGDQNVLSFLSSESVFNDDSKDLDFRVESDTLSHMFFVDAGLDQANVGTNTDYSALLGVIQAKSDHRALNVEGNNSSFASNAINVGVIRNSSGEYNFINCEARGFANKFRVTDAGAVLAVTTTISSISDERIKQDITDANSQWDDIKALKFKNFKRKTAVRNEGDDALRELGVIAQDVEAAGMTGLIDYSDPDTGHVQDDPTFGTLYTQEDEDAGNIPSGKFVKEVKEVKEQVKMVKYSIIWMKAVKALQEAQTRIEELETKVKALEDA